MRYYQRLPGETFAQHVVRLENEDKVALSPNEAEELAAALHYFRSRVASAQRDEPALPHHSTDRRHLQR